MLVKKQLMEQCRPEGKAGGSRGAQQPEVPSSVENRARVVSPSGVDPSRMSDATSRLRLCPLLLQHGSVARVAPPLFSEDTPPTSDIDERCYALIGAA